MTFRDDWLIFIFFFVSSSPPPHDFDSLQTLGTQDLLEI